MREILFKGKRKDNGEWIFRDSIAKCAYTTDDKTGEVVDISSYYFGNIIVDAKTVGQYTGLTDKNGKKIFEGDICIDRGGNIHLVKYGEFTPKNFYRMFGCESSLVLYGVHTLSGAIECIIPAKHTLEVIGNIHDNPELLKGGGEE